MRVSIVALALLVAAPLAVRPVVAQSAAKRAELPKLEEASKAADATFESAEAALRALYDELDTAVSAERGRSGATWVAELGRVVEPISTILAKETAGKKGSARVGVATSVIKRESPAALEKLEVSALKTITPYLAARLAAVAARTDLADDAYQAKGLATLVLEELLGAKAFHLIWNESLAPTLAAAETYRKTRAAAVDARWDFDVARDPVLQYRRGAPEGFARVTAGSYVKYASEGQGANSPRPKQTAVVPNDVFIGLHEVTNAEYFAWWSALDEEGKNRHIPRGDDPKKSPLWTTPEGGAGPEPTPEQRPVPVVGVALTSAAAYAAAKGARLPTEAEWCAAAGGRDGFRFPWGAEWKPLYANDADAGVGALVEPGKHPLGRGPFGHFDLAGNAEEWTATYVSGKDVDFAKLDTSQLVIVRGGSFNCAKDHVSNHWQWHRRAAFDSSVVTGFRLATDVSATRKK